ncbi:MAG TPA: sugar ABC transporter permease [Nocardioidaceae bacterium]|nr:sugar ABC transporter permease [Nocardioidaceae bacterium]
MSGLMQRGRLERQQARVGWLFTTPTLVVLGLVTVFPIVFSVVLSFSEVGIGYEGFAIERPTLENYTALLGSADWRYAVVFTVGYTLVTVAIELVLGMLVALVLERLTAGRGWMMALLLVPWSMITVISAQLWGYLYDASYGAITWGVEALTGTPPLILGQPASAITALVVADVWKTTPFVAIILLAGLVMLPNDVNEAAVVDGAGAWSTFWQVTLPQLKPAVAVAVLFRMLQAFGVFDLPFVLTQGGPGVATQSLAVMGYKTLFQDLNIGPGAAIATTTGLLVMIGCLVFLRVFRAQVGKEDL